MPKTSGALLALTLLAACTSNPSENPTVPATRSAPERVLGTQLAIYFSFGKPGITEHGDEALREHAALIREFAPTRVKLAGHADTAEPDPLALSTARANLVAQRLKELGVSAEIQTRSAGSSELAIPTPPGTRESQNRRVTIDY